ncbi:MAG: hypothetical protein F6K41_06435 [Symploca sp. SIO3E6]|nr:hypothetical protein [Caldora sp. SIO3E6]
MGRWGDGEMGRWGDGEMGDKFLVTCYLLLVTYSPNLYLNPQSLLL